ncbi:hypothetical protein B0E53_05014 [Micromonospora sp. MH33]|nr:hypothetical protein B0E53_05014 [Micromonospora sp. MH33]
MDGRAAAAGVAGCGVVAGFAAAGAARPSADVGASTFVSAWSDGRESSPGLSGGGAMPGARVNFGAGASAGTVARPTAARPVAGVPPCAASSSTGLAEVPLFPDFACVSVIN